MIRVFLALALLLGGCSSANWKPSADRKAEPVLKRGWSFVEDRKNFMRLDSGVTPVSYSGPVIAGEKLLFGSDRFGITALSKRTGQRLWSKALQDGTSTLPFVMSSGLFVGTDAGQLLHLNLDTGAELWSVNMGAPVHGSMTYAFDRLYVGTADEAIHAVDPATGRVLWTYRRPAFSGTSIRGGGNPSMVGGRIWIGFSDGALVSLDPQTGAVESERVFQDNLKFMDLDAKVIGWKDGLLVSTYDGKLRHLRRDGALIWEFEAGSARAPLLTEGETIYLPSSDGNIYALSGGKEVWRYPLKRGVPTGLALMKQGGKNILVVAASEEKLMLLDALTGVQLSESSFGRGSGSYAPIAVDELSGTFYVLSSYSRIYQFRLNL